MRTIEGAELDKVLLQRHGLTWDSIPIGKITVDDLSREALALFKKKAVESERLSSDDVNVTDNILMENLQLYDDDNLIRAAVMSFYGNPGKWVAGSYIKIGYFVTDSDLKFQDEVQGSLIEQIDKTVSLVYQKYMKAFIYYEGIQRIDKLMFPKDAFREILLNAVVHKNYGTCNPIQISVYEDKIYIYNDGIMPEELSST